MGGLYEFDTSLCTSFFNGGLYISQSITSGQQNCQLVQAFDELNGFGAG